MTRGPQQPSSKKGAVKPEIERNPGKVKTSVDVETTGELRWERTGRKERERTHRGSMENNTEPATGKT